jgi:quercetin dioxygenase-like cupin family protein
MGAGDLVEDPILRQRYRFSREGDVLTVELWIDPGGTGPNHFHPHLEERWEVLDGELTFQVDGRKRPLAPGDRVTVPAGVRHGFQNTSTKLVHARAEVEPALQMQQFLTEGAALNRSGRFTRRGIPKTFGAALDGADFVGRYRESAVLLSPPRPLQQLMLWTLGPLARRRRSRADRRERHADPA